MYTEGMIPYFPAEAMQAVAVRQIEGSDARMALYERVGGEWTKRWECAAHLGKHGVGKQVEGDMKTPLGVYSLTTPFGALPAPGEVRLGEYLQLSGEDYWCAQHGPLYNRLVKAGVTPGYAPEACDEHLIDYIPAYHYGMFIGYNAEGADGRGSAIFLHCEGTHGYTAGCVAAAEDVVRELLVTLDEGAVIVIADAQGNIQ